MKQIILHKLRATYWYAVRRKTGCEGTYQVTIYATSNARPVCFEEFTSQPELDAIMLAYKEREIDEGGAA